MEEIMEKMNSNCWYLTKPKDIYNCLYSVVIKWGCYVSSNRTEDSESGYLKIYFFSRGKLKFLTIRISDHPVQAQDFRTVFDIDIYCGHDRKGAMSYIKFLTILAKELNEAMPPYLKKINKGTLAYKQFRIRMQVEAKRKKRFFRTGVFYA